MIAALLAAVLVAQAGPAPKPPGQLTALGHTVEIVLIPDFQCPFCAQFAVPFRQLQTDGVQGVKTTVTFKNFPLSIHPGAQLAHQAAMAAKAQGKFWEMHDLLFAHQARVQRSDLVGYAKDIGLDVVAFERDLDSEAVKKQISADLAEGVKVGVSGTPTYTVNGKVYSGTKTFAQLDQLIGGEQRRARALAEITDGLMSKGPETAPVMVELFADLESPVSQPAMRILGELLARYPSAIRLQFRNFPLAFHPQAALAHEAAMTAAKEGRFWEFAEYLLDHQEALREQDLIALAGRLGLDQAHFATALREHRYAPRVEADVEAGTRRGLRGSPVVFVGGKRIDGVPSLTALAAYVDAALAVEPANLGKH